MKDRFEEKKEFENNALETFILRQGARNVTDLSKARLIKEPTRLAWQECYCERWSQWLA